MNAVLDLVKVLYEPGAVFERLREKPSFWQPFIAICVVQLVLGVLQLPYTKAAMAAQFAVMPARGGASAPDPSKFAMIGLLFLPIGLLLIFLILAALLWVLTSVFAGDAKFATLLSVTTYAGITFVLLSVAGLATLMLKGVQGITSPADLQPALGLDLLVPEAGPPPCSPQIPTFRSVRVPRPSRTAISISLPTPSWSSTWNGSSGRMPRST